MYGCIYQTADERCMKFTNGKSQSWCVGKDEPCGYRKASNADRIRSMTDEELADMMEDNGDCPPRACPHDGEGNNIGRKECRECWLDWLKQEVET